jgi:predicted DsbA family dithiol-disulfide isomerase
MAKVLIKYFTDPICSWSYANEPNVNRILSDYGDRVDLQHKMWPIIDDLDDFYDEINDLREATEIGWHWKEVSDRTGVYINHLLWFEDPPRTCWPACEAFKCAELQGWAIGRRFLLKERNAYLTRKMNLSRRENIMRIAREAAAEFGLDYARFMTDFNSGRMRKEVERDEKEAEKWGVEVVPTLVFNDQVVERGPTPYERYREVIESLLKA